jgi:hypothetical protein
MTADLLHRIRWANVARAAALLLAILLAVAWPRLRGHAETLPPAVATPATAVEEATTAAPATTRAVAPRATAATRAVTPHAAAATRAEDPRTRGSAAAQGRKARRRVAKRHARRRKRAAAPPPVAPTLPAPVAATPAWRPPPRSSPAAEFRP